MDCPEPLTTRHPMWVSVVFGILAFGFGLATTNPAAAVTSLGATSHVAATDIQAVDTPVMDQSPLVDPDGEFVFTIDLSPLVDNAEAIGIGLPAKGGIDPSTNTANQVLQPLFGSIQIYTAIGSAGELTTEPQQLLNQIGKQPLTKLGSLTDQKLSISIPIRTNRSLDGTTRIRVPNAGVYPIEVSIYDHEGIDIGRAFTHMIRAAEGSDGRDTFGPIALVAMASDATQTAESLAGLRNTNVVTVINGDVLSELESTPELASGFRGALEDRPVVAVGSPAIDPAAVVEIGMPELYVDLHDSTEARMEALGLKPAPSMVAIVTDLTAGAVDLLNSIGIATAIDLRPMAETSSLKTETGQINVLSVSRRHVETLIDDNNQIPATNTRQRVQHLLVNLALERQLANGPGETTVLTVPADVDSSEFDSLITLLNELDETGNRPVLLEELGPTIASRLTTPGSAPNQGLGPTLAKLNTALETLETYQSTYVAGSQPPTEVKSEIVAALDHHLSLVDQASRLDEIATNLNSAIDVISIPPDQGVTLAARSAPIPLILENHADGERSVMLQFRSDKIFVADHGKIVTLAPGSSSIDVVIETRSLGESPLEVSVFTPDGKQQLNSTKFRVRSTAIPGIGLLISIVGMVVLALWWLLTIRQRRLERQQELKS